MQLTPASTIYFPIYSDEAVDDGFFHVPSRVEEPSKLQELAEANDVAADRYVFDAARVSHAGMLADQAGVPESPRSRVKPRETLTTNAGPYIATRKHQAASPVMCGDDHH